MLIYSFGDAQKFLCVYNDDTATLVFVVDVSLNRSNASVAPEWPPNQECRKYLEKRMSDVVTDTKGIVRLPSFVEVEEVSGHLVSMTPDEFKSTMFPCFDLGIYRSYDSKANLLLDLSTNRQSIY